MNARSLRLMSFDGAFNLPLWVAEREGFFADAGMAVSLEFTPNSAFLVQALMSGSAHVAFCGFDNIAAYQFGQGEAQLAEAPDLRAFMGGDAGFLSLVARPGIESIEALSGATLSVDALTTGFAFVLREMLARAGMNEDAVRIVRAGGTATRYAELLAGRHDATLLRTPYERLATARGFRVLARAENLLGPYAGTVGAARLAWIDRHRGLLADFMDAYRAALQWLAAPSHRSHACQMLVSHFAELDPTSASEVLADLLHSRFGLRHDLRLDAEGIATVLALRAKYAGTPETTMDLSQLIDTADSGLQ